MKNKKSGFTLIEVLIAVMIFAGAIMVINNIWSGNLVRIRKARRMNDISFLLKQKLTEYEVKFDGRPLSEIPEKGNGKFEGAYKSYEWEMASREFEMPDFASAIAKKAGGSAEMVEVLIKTMNDFINKSVKELKVTIRAKGVMDAKKKKELEYSATTLFVDYTQELSLPGTGPGASEGSE